MPDLVFHLGYPKTGTTTLQKHVFPHHPDIDYQGKFVPSHRYREERVFPLIYSLQTESPLLWNSGGSLQEAVDAARSNCTKPILLFSSENFLHPETVDLELVALRLSSLFPDAKFVITFRKQVDLLLSFYRSHGAFGHYLFMAKNEEDPITLPLSLAEWMQFQFRTPHKNVLGTLHYEKVARCYLKHCARERIHFCLYEQLADDPQTYLSDLFRFLSVDTEPAGRLWRDRRSNVGLDEREFERLSAKLYNKTCERLGASRKWRLPFGKDLADRWPNQMPDPWLSMTQEMFQLGNQWLRDSLGLPTDRYAYPSLRREPSRSDV